MKIESVMEKFDVGIHLGNILHHTAHHYSEPPVVIREAVQNSIDKKASRILIVIDALHRTIKVYDNGIGASYEEIKEKFGKVAVSLKIDSEDIGEKGIGNLAGLSIAETYHIVTKVKDSSEQIRRYSLHRKRLIGQEKVTMDVEIWPGKGVGGGINFPATTLVQLVEVNEQALRRLNNIEVIERVLLDAFGKKIRDSKIEIKVVYSASAGKGWEKIVKPGEFRGTKLEPETYQTKFGPVVFEMYYSLRPLDKPNLVVEHKGKCSIALANLSHPVIGQLNPKAMEAFKKGYFEGIIKLDFGTLSPDRGAFEWDDELVAFSDVVEEFALEILQPLVNRNEEEHRDEKYRKISDEILKRIGSYYKDHPEMRPDFIRDIDIIEEGAGEPAQPEKSPKKPRYCPDPNVIRKERERYDRERNERSKTPGSTKTSQTGETTSVRKLSNRPGNIMHISYVVPEEEFGVSWHSRRVEATIEINVQNSDFGVAETLGTSKLRDYVTLLVQKEITCASLDGIRAKDWGDRFEDTFMQIYKAALGQ